MHEMNRIYNAKNPAQGDRKRVLCCCSAGLLRSPTTAAVLAQEYGYNTRAAGCEPSFALIPVDEVLLHWADEVVVMNEDHAGTVRDLGYEGVLINLDIPDSYMYMDPELQKIIKDRYESSFEGELQVP